MIEPEIIREKYPILTETPADKKGWKRGAIAEFTSTPKSLYRFLYIWEPKHVDFSDMYKRTFEAFLHLLEMRHNVYPGNNFRV